MASCYPLESTDTTTKQRSFTFLTEIANTSSSSTKMEKIFSDTDRELYEYINYVFVSSVISLFGLVANVMNLVVFYKQGFASTMNISFFTLAITDLGGLVTLLWCCICVNPLFANSDLPLVSSEVQYLTGGLPRVFFGRINAWITVFITAERCMSIIFPLRIKQIITPMRTTVILCLIYLVVMAAFLPEYGTAYMTWKFYPEKNKTLLGLGFTENREHVEGLMYIMYSFLGTLAFIAVIIFTLLLVIQLKQKSKWRKTANVGKSMSESISQRERKTMTMVVMIALVLIVCYLPGAVVSIITFFCPEFSIVGVNVNAFFVMWSFVFIFDATNSSVNIFLYYKMSSKYRDTFNQIFGFTT